MEQNEAQVRAKKEFLVFSTILTILLSTSLIVTVLLHLSNPTISIQDFYVPSLNNNSTTTTTNASVFIDLRFERKATVTRPGYACFQMTLFYGRDRRLPVADCMVEGFSMGRRKRVDVKVAVEAARLPWEAAYWAVSGGLEVEFMLQLMEIGSDKNWVSAGRVRVGGSGHRVPENPIKVNYIGSVNDDLIDEDDFFF